MKKLMILFSILFIGFSTQAKFIENIHLLQQEYNGSSYIFRVDNVAFSVFPNGEFDFAYLGAQQGNQFNIKTSHANISFNAGYNYDAYVQYDTYGAIIQVENVPIYYDNFGRITQAGNVNIQYRNRQLTRIGGLHIFYNGKGNFSHYTGVINQYNRQYVYHPWHQYFTKPSHTRTIVYNRPYRKNYHPGRYSYQNYRKRYKKGKYRSYSNNRRSFKRPGNKVHHKNRRVSSKRRKKKATNNKRSQERNTSSRRTVSKSKKNRRAPLRNKRSRRKNAQSRKSAIKRKTSSQRRKTTRPQSRSRTKAPTHRASRKSTPSKRSTSRSRARPQKSSSHSKSSSRGTSRRRR